MRERIIILLLVLLLFSGCTARKPKDFTITEFDWERAYGDILALCSFGPRLSGSENEAKGVEYIISQLKDAGVSVHVEYFNLTCYDVKQASMALVQYDPLGLIPINRTEFQYGKDFILQGYSGSTDGTETFDIIFAGDGTNESYEDKDVKEKAVIVQKNASVSFSSAYFNAAAHGASANLFHNTGIHPELDYPPISVTAVGKIGNETVPYPDAYPDMLIPSMMISNKTGQTILNAINQTVPLFKYRLEMNISVWIGKRQIPVVIGEIKGDNKMVIIGAHSDTVHVSSGAVDNTAGVATVLEIARQLAKTNPRHTIRLAFWSGEEEGIFGSTFYCKKYQEVIEKNLLAYLNLDMNHINLKRGNKGEINSNDNTTLQILKNISAAAQEKHPGFSKYNISFSWWNCIGGSDQSPFAEMNKTTACFWGSGCREYHTIWDTPEHITPESLEVSGIIFGSYALHLANS